jgi:hypothetical protein
MMLPNNIISVLKGAWYDPVVRKEFNRRDAESNRQAVNDQPLVPFVSWWFAENT